MIKCVFLSKSSAGQMIGGSIPVSSRYWTPPPQKIAPCKLRWIKSVNYKCWPFSLSPFTCRQTGVVDVCTLEAVHKTNKQTNKLTKGKHSVCGYMQVSTLEIETWKRRRWVCVAWIYDTINGIIAIKMKIYDFLLIRFKFEASFFKVILKGLTRFLLLLLCRHTWHDIFQ